MAFARTPAPRRSARLAVALVALLGALAGQAALAQTALASHSQVAIIQDDPQLIHNPAPALLRFRQLGAQQVRVALRWYHVAPDADSFRAPAHFDASNPADYSNASWSPYDTIVRDATADGIQVNFNVVGGGPLWATGPGMPGPKNAGYPFHQWEPSATAFGEFMRALGTRYSGNYNPQARKIERGNKNDLPRVDFWSIWNEPDYGPSLAPQALPGHPGVPYSPMMYRSLVDQAWSALHATGHGSDSVLVGELAPRATSPTFGVFNGMLPITFVQSLYCLGSTYQPLGGKLAILEGCPTTAAGSARFASQNPALFKMTGFSDHPYMSFYPPNDEENPTNKLLHLGDFSTLVKGFTSLATIGNLENALDRVMAAYRSPRTIDIWNTEFGYMTSPPKRIWANNPQSYPSPTTAALWDNWAEYISWKDPRIASFEQYQLYDPLPANKADNYGGYASGLLNYGGQQKPGYGAWRLPLYLPQTTAKSRGDALEVWGDVRPAGFSARDYPYRRVMAQLLFKPAHGGGYTLLDTVTVGAPEGYFDIHVKFPTSGTLLMRWYYPNDPTFGSAAGKAVFSRPVTVTVK